LLANCGREPGRSNAINFPPITRMKCESQGWGGESFHSFRPFRASAVFFACPGLAPWAIEFGPFGAPSHQTGNWPKFRAQRAVHYNESAGFSVRPSIRSAACRRARGPRLRPRGRRPR
jgi:hypothetical protein